MDHIGACLFVMHALGLIICMYMQACTVHCSICKKFLNFHVLFFKINHIPINQYFEKFEFLSAPFVARILNPST